MTEPLEAHVDDAPDEVDAEVAPGLYRIQTIARRTGFSTAVLRAWERRYGLLRPSRAPGGFRVYADEELRLLERVRALLDQGLTIGDIARMGRDALLGATAPEPFAPARGTSSVGSDLADEFVQLVEHGDVRGAEEVVSRALHADLPRGPLTEFVQPALERIGTAWERHALSPGVERIATHLLRVPLEAMLSSANMGLGPMRVVCSPGPGDTHELGALMVALACARGGIGALHLSGPLDPEHLATVVRLTRVRAVCLSYVQVPDRAYLDAGLRKIVRLLPPRTRVVVGGRGAQGFGDVIRAAGAMHLDDLHALVPLLAGR